MKLSKKRVLVTGGCGTVGSELVRQLLQVYAVKKLVVVDNNESGLFEIEKKYAGCEQAYFCLADVRDRDRLCDKMKGIDLVFHTAAFKHVLLCERSPFEAVQTNIHGVQNVIYAAIQNAVKRVIFTSSDKAVNPTNVMGTTKLMGERLVTAANCDIQNFESIFSSVRFGNVLGSRGSVVPVFLNQIRSGGPVTVTDPEMTRFIMSVAQAVDLIINAARFCCGGEVFVAKMPAIRIGDLAQVMIEQLAPFYGYLSKNIDIQIIGYKPGEKMYEELISSEEKDRLWKFKDYFVVLPAFEDVYKKIDYDYPDIKSKKMAGSYQSNNEIPLSKNQLKKFLINNGIFRYSK